MKIVIILCFIVTAISIAMIGFKLIGFKFTERDYPDPKDLPVVNGIINHPTYGEYPENIPFRQGMTLMPGQSSDLKV